MTTATVDTSFNPTLQKPATWWDQAPTNRPTAAARPAAQVEVADAHQVKMAEAPNLAATAVVAAVATAAVFTMGVTGFLGSWTFVQFALLAVVLYGTRRVWSTVFGVRSRTDSVWSLTALKRPIISDGPVVGVTAAALLSMAGAVTAGEASLVALAAVGASVVGHAVVASARS